MYVSTDYPATGVLSKKKNQDGKFPLSKALMLIKDMSSIKGGNLN
jgi:hypothetical protein